MARGKKTTSGGRSNGVSKKGMNTKHRQASNSEAVKESQKQPFSLRDAARTTEHERRYWDSPSSQLRHQSMTFVRSVQHPEGDERPEVVTGDAARSRTRDSRTAAPDWSRNTGRSERGEQFGAEGTDEPQAKTPSQGSTQESCLTTSSTSEDEVVFAGRGSQHFHEPGNASQHKKPHYAVAYAKRGERKHDFNLVPDLRLPDLHGADSQPASQSKGPQFAIRERGKPFSHYQKAKTAEEVAINDYVENVLKNQDEEPLGEEIAVSHGDDGWSSSDFQDFDIVSTSEEIQGTISRVISKRDKPGGVQYLVVWENQSVDEARWVLHSSMPQSATSLVMEFELRHRKAPELPEIDIAGDSNNDAEIEWGSDEDSESEENRMETDDSEDEQDLVQRHMERMTDEHIARLLQKQEVLGIYSNDLELFDGDEDRTMPVPMRSSRSTPRMVVPAFSNKERKRYRQQSRLALQLDDEELEQGLGVEIQGFERNHGYELNNMQPSGGSSGFFAFELSDSDMANEMKAAWACDRKKKKAQKQAREELRAQGRLGRKGSRFDLKAKYRDGMNFHQMQTELEDFLFSEQEQLSLPPMDKRHRKAIHDIANQFGLNSKSQGSGKKRFPVLHKTRRTISFDDAAFDELRSQIDRRLFSRQGVKGKNFAGSSSIKRSGVANRRDITYRDGEVVGASAPEIGTENRGRAMLEKMGWSTGNALGSLNNQGILKPIEHIIKNSRAGLG